MASKSYEFFSLSSCTFSSVLFGLYWSVVIVVVVVVIVVVGCYCRCLEFVCNLKF